MYILVYNKLFFFRKNMFIVLQCVTSKKALCGYNQEIQPEVAVNSSHITSEMIFGLVCFLKKGLL